MGPLPSLVYYACIAKDTVVLAEYCDGAPELSAMALKTLQRIPPYHRRFNHTAKRRMLNCLIEDPFVYCAIVDEALGKAKAYSFLEQVRDEFKNLLNTRRLTSDGEALGPHSLDDVFMPVFRHLVAPFVGIPQKESMYEEAAAQQEIPGNFEISSPSAVVPSGDANEEFFRKTGKKPSDSFLAWLGKNKRDKKKVKDQVKKVKEIMVENNDRAMDNGQTLEVIVDGSSQTFQDPQSGRMDRKGEQLAQRMWWRNVRFVLMLDAVVCIVLFGIWLGICRGISCIKS